MKKDTNSIPKSDTEIRDFETGKKELANLGLSDSEIAELYDTLYTIAENILDKLFANNNNNFYE